MAVNKVEINGETKLDLTGDTVTPEKLLSGATAHNAAGVQITGSAEPGAKLFLVTLTSPEYEVGYHSDATADKTFAEILAAYQSGKIVQVKWGEWSLRPVEIDESYGAYFSSFEGGTDVQVEIYNVTAFCGANSDWEVGYYQNEIPFASDAIPKAPGTAKAGVLGEFARGDHVHPHDSAKIDNPAVKSDGQALVYNGTTGKWEAKTPEGGSAEFFDVTVTTPTGGVGAATETTADKEFAEIWRAYQQGKIIRVFLDAYVLSLVYQDGGESMYFAATYSMPYDTDKIYAVSATCESADVWTIEMWDKEIPQAVQASSAAPKMDGTASAGSSSLYARGDHVHPHDSAKIDEPASKSDGQALVYNGTTKKWEAKTPETGETVFLVTLTSSAYVTGYYQDVTADKTFSEILAAYQSGKTVRAEWGGWLLRLVQVNERFGVIFSAFEGGTDVQTELFDVTAYCDADDNWEIGSYTNSIPEASDAAPKANGTASPGTHDLYAREDHVHPRELPAVSTSDNGKFLRVVSGKWAAASIASANGGSF